MSGKRDFDNSEFKIIAKRYVSIYGETLEKEALSEEVQALKQPEMPDLGRAKKKNSVSGVAILFHIVKKWLSVNWTKSLKKQIIRSE